VAHSIVIKRVSEINRCIYIVLFIRFEVFTKYYP